VRATGTKSIATTFLARKAGESRSFQVTAIGATSLVGNAVKVPGGGSDAVGARIDMPYAVIAQIEVRRDDGLKNLGLIAAVLAAGVAIASGHLSLGTPHRYLRRSERCSNG
jgi:4-hydroxybenzoate polyprenyltransferase